MPKMKLPKYVKVGAWDYTIVEFAHVDAACSSRFGDCRTNDKRIRVDLVWGRRKAAHTLLHEILHAVYYEWSMQKEDDEERLVDILASGLAAVWRDNPAVMQWIAEGLT